MKHIIERFLIHFFSSAGLYLIVYFVVNYLERKWRHWKLAMPAIIALGFAGWREAYDVSTGQTFLKAVTDYASWTVGLGVAVWALYRYRKNTFNPPNVSTWQVVKGWFRKTEDSSPALVKDAVKPSVTPPPIPTASVLPAIDGNARTMTVTGITLNTERNRFEFWNHNEPSFKVHAWIQDGLEVGLRDVIEYEPFNRHYGFFIRIHHGSRT